MDTVYFIMFCFIIAYVIFWCLQNDDQAEFTGQKRDEKFSAKNISDKNQSPE